MNDQHDPKIDAFVGAVLVQAFAALTARPSCKETARQVEIEAQRARHWIMSDKRSHPLNYLDCCIWFGLDPEAGRRKAEWLMRKNDEVLQNAKRKR